MIRLEFLSRVHGFSAAVAALFFFASSCAVAAIMFEPGHIYTTDYHSNVLSQHDEAGNLMGTLNLGRETKGLAFGPDGLLYVVTMPETFGYEVIAIDETGVVHQTYSGTTYVRGNLSYGKVSVDDKYLYVTGQDNLTRFEVNDPAASTVIYNDNQIYDVEILPSGNLLVASAYDIHEITVDGGFVRSIEPPGRLYTDVRGVEYDPATNDIFVTHLGHSNFFFRIMRVDYVTGALEESVQYHYADDMFVSRSGDLIVGSRTQVPGVFGFDLVQHGNVGATSQMFVTQYTIPEPAALLLCCIVGIAGSVGRRARET